MRGTNVARKTTAVMAAARQSCRVVQEDLEDFVVYDVMMIPSFCRYRFELNDHGTDNDISSKQVDEKGLVSLSRIVYTEIDLIEILKTR